MSIVKSIELREDNVNEVIEFTQGNGKIYPADGKFKLKDQGGALVTVSIGDYIGMDSHGGFHVLGFVPDIAPNIDNLIPETKMYKGSFTPDTMYDTINSDFKIIRGFTWMVFEDGVYAGRKLKEGDFLVALVDGAGNNAEDWVVIYKDVERSILNAPSWKQALIDNKDYYVSSVNNLVALCAGLANEAGWDEKQREMGTKLMLIVSEISEAMEGDRKNLMDDHLPHRPMVQVECVDATVRILHLAGEQKMDFGNIFVEKLIYNTERADHKPENRDKENGKKY